LRIIIIDFIQINKKQNGKNKEKPVYWYTRVLLFFAYFVNDFNC
jgi:hypothetical protein